MLTPLEAEAKAQAIMGEILTIAGESFSQSWKKFGERRRELDNTHDGDTEPRRPTFLEQLDDELDARQAERVRRWHIEAEELGAKIAALPRPDLPALRAAVVMATQDPRVTPSDLAELEEHERDAHKLTRLLDRIGRELRPVR